MSEPITTALGTTVQLHEDQGRTYVLSSNQKHNELALSSVLIGEVVHIDGIGPTYAPSRGTQIALGPDVLRAIITLIETQEDQA